MVDLTAMVEFDIPISKLVFTVSIGLFLMLWCNIKMGEYIDIGIGPVVIRTVLMCSEQ